MLKHSPSGEPKERRDGPASECGTKGAAPGLGSRLELGSPAGEGGGESGGDSLIAFGTG